MGSTPTTRTKFRAVGDVGLCATIEIVNIGSSPILSTKQYQDLDTGEGLHRSERSLLCNSRHNSVWFEIVRSHDLIRSVRFLLLVPNSRNICSYENIFYELFVSNYESGLLGREAL